MSTICSMIQGCGPFDQFKVETVKTKDFPPSREMRIGVAPFGAPAAEELFSVCCTAVRRSRMPEDLVHDLAAQAVMKLLEE